MTEISAKLYNQALDLIENGIKTNNYENISTLDKKLKTDEYDNNYRKLKAQVAQQIIKLAQKSWKSYFKSLSEYKKNPNKFSGYPKPPKHKEQFLLIYTNQCSSIKNNKIVISKAFNTITIPMYKNVSFNEYQSIRIIPKQYYIKIEIIYKVDEINSNVDVNNFMSIDLGINNLCSIVTKNNAFLIDGKDIKSINRFYNKKKANLKKIQNKKNILTKQLFKLYENRENKIKDKLHKVSRYIINYCLKNNIGTIICGYNKGWKDSINLGKRNNQKIVSIPHEKLINFLKYKCDLVGLSFLTIEESYTSKCDSLALENVEKQSIYKGKRIKRGLFYSSIGKLINADINGALNILRKCKGDDWIINLLSIPACIGFLFNPVRVRL